VYSDHNNFLICSLNLVFKKLFFGKYFSENLF